MAEAAQAPDIPDYVLNDFNEDTLKRYLTDADFRTALLTDPVAASNQFDLGLSNETTTWIHDRIHEHGLRAVLGGVDGDLVAM